MVKDIKIIIGLLLISIQPVTAQVEYFNIIDAHHPVSAAWGVVEADSFYYVTGTMIDTVPKEHARIFFDKYTLNGDFVSSRSWRDTAKTYVIGWTSPLIETSDNGFALIGSVKDTTNFWHGVLMKLNMNGDSLWMRHYYDTISADTNNYLGFKGIKETYDKGFIIVGQIAESQQSNSDVFLLRTDSLGNTEWYKTYGYMATIDRGFSVIQTPDSGYVIGGDVYNAVSVYSGDAYLIRTDKYGNQIWDKFLGGTKSDLVAHVALSHDSNYIVAYSYAYYQNQNGYAKRNINAIKISPEKQTLWAKTFWIHTDHSVKNIIELEDHSIAIVGWSWVIDTINQVGGRESFIMKLSENGDSLWYRDYSHVLEISNDIFNYLIDIKPTKDGGFIACGNYQDPFGGIVQAAWLVKTDSLGCDTPGCNTIGIHEYPYLNISDINIYPNPAYNYVNVKVNVPFNRYLYFELFDCYGRKVKKIELTKPNNTISLDGVNDGMYFYRVRIKGKILGIGKVLVVR